MAAVSGSLRCALLKANDETGCPRYDPAVWDKSHHNHVNSGKVAHYLVPDFLADGHSPPVGKSKDGKDGKELSGADLVDMVRPGSNVGKTAAHQRGGQDSVGSDPLSSFRPISRHDPAKPGRRIMSALLPQPALARS
jgi:hypothetical protein